MISDTLGRAYLYCLCSVLLCAAAPGPALAITQQAKEPASPPVTKRAIRPPVDRADKLPTPVAIKTGTSSLPAKQPEPSLKQSKQTMLPLSGRPSTVHNRQKFAKKVRSKAVLRPKNDVVSHGMLEDPQRYDPRLNHRTAGVQDPRTPELAHDHFQELDRNQDGKIDPVERVFGRLDMDRDLPNRHY